MPKFHVAILLIAFANIQLCESFVGDIVSRLLTSDEKDDESVYALYGRQQSNSGNKRHDSQTAGG